MVSTVKIEHAHTGVLSELELSKANSVLSLVWFLLLPSLKVDVAVCW